MNVQELTNKISSEIQLEEKDNNCNVSLMIDNEDFSISDVYIIGRHVYIESTDTISRNQYRFTYLMYDYIINKNIGITHRTYSNISDKEVIEHINDYNMEGFSSITYILIRIERILDEESNIYKTIWELNHFNDESIIKTNHDICEVHTN